MNQLIILKQTISLFNHRRNRRKTANSLATKKAQKNVTRALNKLTEMQEDTDLRIQQLSKEQEEQEFNISYFEAFETDLLDLPGNTGEFLQELKDQINLLEQNGKAVKKEIAENQKLVTNSYYLLLSLPCSNPILCMISFTTCNDFKAQLRRALIPHICICRISHTQIL